MSFVRVYYDEDGVIYNVEYPNPHPPFKIDTVEKLEVLKKHPKFEHLSTKIIPASSIEAVKSSHDYTPQLELNGDSVVVNENKDKGMMPSHIIKAKHYYRMMEKIEDEMAKESPDMMVVTRYQLESEACKKYSEIECYEQALKNLDEDGHDKPVIRQKLDAKITELKAKEK